VGFPPINKDRSLREKLTNVTLSSERFECLLTRLIPSFIPKSYVEDFPKLRENALNTLPKTPTSIFTANAYQADEMFKVWAAEKASAGVPLIIGQHGGTFGICGAISFHPLKNLGGLGDGGMLLTKSKEIYEKVKLYRNHGMESRDNCVEFGVNSRLDILNSEVLKFRLTKLDKVNEKRRANANLYRKSIKAEQVFIPSDDVKQKTSYVMFLVLCENRDKLKEYLSSKGIETLVYYGTPLHLHKASEKFGYKIGDFPVAEKQCDKVLALPHHQHITESQIQFVSDHINKFYGN
jgi:dTDP-4-amino-4,6-dideoxygalactose transaminase